MAGNNCENDVSLFDESFIASLANVFFEDISIHEEFVVMNNSCGSSCLSNARLYIKQFSF